MLSRRCKSSRGQRLATSPVATSAGGRRQTSEAGWNKSAGSVWSLESCLQVVVPQGITTRRTPDPPAWEARTVSRRWNAVSALSLWARQGGGHRGRRPDHGDTGRARELVRASSASCLDIRGSVQSRVLCGESTARSKLPWERPAAPSGRSIHQNAGTTGTEGQAGTRRNSGRALGSRSGS